MTPNTSVCDVGAGQRNFISRLLIRPMVPFAMGPANGNVTCDSEPWREPICQFLRWRFSYGSGQTTITSTKTVSSSATNLLQQILLQLPPLRPLIQMLAISLVRRISLPSTSGRAGTDLLLMGDRPILPGQLHWRTVPAKSLLPAIYISNRCNILSLQFNSGLQVSAFSRSTVVDGQHSDLTATKTHAGFLVAGQSPAIYGCRKYRGWRQNWRRQSGGNPPKRLHDYRYVRHQLEL